MKDSNLNATEHHTEWHPCDLQDFSKLRIADGRIHFSLYQQDGSLQAMSCADTYQNRLYVSWFQMHDRYTIP